MSQQPRTQSTKATKAAKSAKATKATKSSTSSQSVRSYVAFWKPTGLDGIYSQWYMSKITLDDRIRSSLPSEITDLRLFTDYPDVIRNLNGTYNCAEQFMMAGKSYLFDDEVTALKIRSEVNPSRHKKLGRTVQNFDNNTWSAYCTDIVTLGSYLKFSQNKPLKREMLKTAEATLIEGSPMDRIWGVGLRYDDLKISDPKNWKGQNLLGECLMTARKIILNEE